MKQDCDAVPVAKPAAIHDFARKLQRPGLREPLLAYVEWRRAVRAAAEQGQPKPTAPDFAPLSINLDLSTACNYACGHCIDWDALNLPDKHDLDELYAGLRGMAERGLRSVILIGGGEPTLHPAFGQVVRFLKDLKLQVAVVTNGSRNEVITAVADAFTHGDWVRLSLDASSDEVFQAMHRPKGRGIDLDTICRTAAEIRVANPAVQLGYSFVITWRGASRADESIIENVHEMEAAALRAKLAGFDYISFKPFLSRALEGAEVLAPDSAEAGQAHIIERVQECLDAARQHEDETFRVIESTNLRVFLAGTWREFTRQPQVCHMQALRQVVSPLGVFNCPAHRGVEKARLGDSGLWADLPKAQAATATILDGFDARHECREVTCLYNPANLIVEALIAGDADPAQSLPEAGEPGDAFL
jgi:pyruvate-formate lyase-activating enzyme